MSISGIHRLYSGLLCGEIGYKKISRASAVPMTRIRGAKQATTPTFLERGTFRYATRLTDSIMTATSVVISIMQKTIQKIPCSRLNIHALCEGVNERPELTVLKQCNVNISHGRGSPHWNATVAIEASVQTEMKMPIPSMSNR